MRYDWKEIEPLMVNNWQAAIMSIVNVPRSAFSPKHGPCPSCSGVDRYRFDDNLEYKGDGGAICNQCGSGSGLTWLMKLSGMTFPESLEALAEFLNMTPREKLDAIRKEMPKVNHNSDYLTEGEVSSVMEKTTMKTANPWTISNGIGCDIQAINGKSGELVAVPMVIADIMTPCNVAFIADDNSVAFKAGYNDEFTKGRITRGSVTLIGETGDYIYLVSDYVDAWKAHYMTGANIWCCWSPENMWEVVRIVDDETRKKMRCIINNKFDEICAAENADLPILIGDDADEIALATKIRKRIYKADDLLNK